MPHDPLVNRNMPTREDGESRAAEPMRREGVRQQFRERPRLLTRWAHRKNPQVEAELGQHLPAGAAGRRRRIAVAHHHDPAECARARGHGGHQRGALRAESSVHTRRSRRCTRCTPFRRPLPAPRPPESANTARRRAAGPPSPPRPGRQPCQMSPRKERPESSGDTPRNSATVWPTSAKVVRSPSGTGRTRGP